MTFGHVISWYTCSFYRGTGGCVTFTLPMSSVGMTTSTFRYARPRCRELEIEGWIRIGAEIRDGPSNNKQWVKLCPIRWCGSYLSELVHLPFHQRTHLPYAHYKLVFYSCSRCIVLSDRHCVESIIPAVFLKSLDAWCCRMWEYVYTDCIVKLVIT